MQLLKKILSFIIAWCLICNNIVASLQADKFIASQGISEWCENSNEKKKTKSIENEGHQDTNTLVQELRAIVANEINESILKQRTALRHIVFDIFKWILSATSLITLLIMVFLIPPSITYINDLGNILFRVLLSLSLIENLSNRSLFHSKWNRLFAQEKLIIALKEIISDAKKSQDIHTLRVINDVINYIKNIYFVRGKSSEVAGKKFDKIIFDKSSLSSKAKIKQHILHEFRHVYQYLHFNLTIFNEDENSENLSDWDIVLWPLIQADAYIFQARLGVKKTRKFIFGMIFLVNLSFLLIIPCGILACCFWLGKKKVKKASQDKKNKNDFRKHLILRLIKAPGSQRKIMPFNMGQSQSSSSN